MESSGDMVVHRFHQGNKDEIVPMDVQKVIIDSKIEGLPENFCRYRSDLQEVILHEGLRVIGVGAFQFCASLLKVKIYAMTARIDACAFYGCDSLREVEFVTPCYSRIKKIGTFVFEHCKSLERIKIPPTLKVIEYNAFKSTGLVELILSTSDVRIILERSFETCVSLQTASMPMCLQRIYSEAFRDCSSLVTVEMPSGHAIQIQSQAFRSCTSLANILIPRGSFVNNSAFQDCALLQDRFGPVKSDILHGLKDRFDKHPVHNLCYRGSTTTVNALFQGANDNKKKEQQSVVDVFGMTPFHIVCSSPAPRRNLFEILLKAYPPTILGWKDANGKRAMNYLATNWTQETKILLEMALQHWLSKPMNQWGTFNGKADTSNRVQDLLGTIERDDRVRLLNEICVLFEHYEQIEAMSVLGMALWKANIKSERSHDGTKKLALDRERCLIQCGSNFVLPNVIAFLGIPGALCHNLR